MTIIEIEAFRATDATLLKARGKITIGVGDLALREAIEGAAMSRPTHVILDLDGVTTVDSSGIGELVASYTYLSKRGHRLTLTGLPNRVSDILHITQMWSIFDVKSTAREALAKILGRPGAESSFAEIIPDLYLRSRAKSLVVVPALVESTHLLREQLAREPSGLYNLAPRRFEELIAELIEDMGWSVHLTPTSHDGGRDIIAILPTDLGRHLCLVETKRFSAHRKVGIGLVRQLYGTICHEDASSGLMVTTSFYSRDAKEFAETHKHRLEIKDYHDVVKWLRSRR